MSPRSAPGSPTPTLAPDPRANHRQIGPTLSLQPLRLSPGRRLAAGFAGIFTMTSIAAGSIILLLIFLQTDPGESANTDRFLLAAALVVAFAFIIGCHLLMRAALGRTRTGGSLARFFRYQLAALGVGGGLGLGFVPAAIDAAPIRWVVFITAGIALIAVSLLAFRKARYPILEGPPHPSIGLAEGRVVDYSPSSRARAPSLAVVHFIDAQGRGRWVRHLVQQSPSMQGTIGQVVYDRHRPERVRRFAVTHQLFDLRPPREIRENPASQPHHVTPMPPGHRPTRRR